MPVSSLEADLLVASILGRDLAAVDRAVARFAELFGELAFVSAPLEFTWTDYYRNELGDTPSRRIVAASRFEDTSRLPEIKRSTHRLEVTLSRPGSPREVNIDPGLLGVDQLVLASMKPSAHRIHLGRGIFAELTLIFGPEGFSPLPWTYPDYASAPMLEIFERLRQLLLELRRMRSVPCDP